MTTEDDIRKKLENVFIPGIMRNPIKMNLLKEIKIHDGKVDITMSRAALSDDLQDWIKNQIRKNVGTAGDVKEIDVQFRDDSPKDLNQISHIIAVMSGKGGVGKSLVSSLAAIALNRAGYEVGILDADITGPSIPRMFGITNSPAGSDTGIIPVLSTTDIELMSINLLIPEDDTPVIWRGPLIARAITQFWEEVLWGNLDYLIVDLPPGTSDAAITVMQSIPVSGVIIVSTPQDLTSMIVRKAVKMVRDMNKNIIGVIENMSYLYLPEINKQIEIFGKSSGEEMAKAADAPLLAKLPIDPELARLCDEGKIELYQSPVMSDLNKIASATVPTER